MTRLLVLVMIFSSCTGSEPLQQKIQITLGDISADAKVVLEPLIVNKGFSLTLYQDHAISDRTIFKYQYYKLDTADIDRDGHTDILVGIIKPTEFDPVEKKRLFILRVDNGQLRPLWLGSKVCQELIDFKTVGNGIVQTFERTKNGKYAVGNYKWQSFGLALINYKHNDIRFDDAFTFFHQ
jgi:hypothetical protein